MKEYNFLEHYTCPSTGRTAIYMYTCAWINGVARALNSLYMLMNYSRAYKLHIDYNIYTDADPVNTCKRKSVSEKYIRQNDDDALYIILYANL